MAVKEDFQGDNELQRFVLPEAHPTSRTLRVGSYGSVRQLEVNGLLKETVGTAKSTLKYCDEFQVMDWLDIYPLSAQVP